MSLAPDHRLWQRHRLPHHGGALRTYMKRPTHQYGRTSPQYCHTCTEVQYKLRQDSFWALDSQRKFDLLDDIEYSHQLSYNQS